MNRIRLLSEQVANQIAAGEVIERPASVVKELVENALDAQARQIVVEVQAGGRSLIRVSDDGVGMSKDDALLCLERHATSKIQSADDLNSIATMGFRGEALPSIASVSRLTLTTRERDSGAVAATQVVINGGRILDVKEASGAPGTDMEVRQLFFNVPARRKFLRSDETERAHIQHYLTLAALAYPEVGFTFTSDGRMIWQLPAIKSISDSASRLAALHERFRALYSGDLKLYQSTSPPNSRVRQRWSPRCRGHPELWGFIGAPGVSRATRQEQHLFVNRRPVDNRGLNYALMEGYHTSLMKGRYPVCCLFLESDPGEVDVNIHPSKREVKFHREREVRQFVAHALRQTLLACHAATPTTEGRAESLTSRGSSPPKCQEPATLETKNVTATGSDLLHLPPATSRESVASLPAGGSGLLVRAGACGFFAILDSTSAVPSVPAGVPPSRLPASDVATANFGAQGVRCCVSRCVWWA
jgi:DNA mismatch repair protein MutL